MTATDELRRMLDERGVEYRAIGDATFWETHDGAFRYKAKSHAEKLMVMTCCSQKCIAMTPVQAIAATLGAGTCKPREVRSRFSKTQEYVTYHCECGHELGGYMTAELPFPRTYNEDKLPNFCPNCGRRVMDE